MPSCWQKVWARRWKSSPTISLCCDWRQRSLRRPCPSPPETNSFLAFAEFLLRAIVLAPAQPDLAGFGAGSRIGLALLEGELALQLAVGIPARPIQRTVGQRRLNGTAGLRAMPAIVKAARRRQRLDIGERRRDAAVCVPQAKLTHAGGVEDQRAVGQQDQLAMRRRVAAKRVASNNRLRLHQRLAGERIDQR